MAFRFDYTFLLQKLINSCNFILKHKRIGFSVQILKTAVINWLEVLQIREYFEEQDMNINDTT